MKFQKFITNLFKSCKSFSLICIGAMLAMFLEYGFSFAYLLCTLLAITVYTLTDVVLDIRRKELNTMSQYCPLCDEYTNCTENCKQCLKEESENNEVNTQQQ